MPVLILSVRADEADKVVALDAGAQDYVVKPFAGKEFLTRVRGLLRDRSTDAVPSVLTIGALRIDAADQSASMEGATQRLTRREFDLLWMLASHHGRLVRQDMTLRAIWGPTHADDAQYLRVSIRQLRQKLGDDAANLLFIAAKPGLGYRFLEAPGD